MILITTSGRPKQRMRSLCNDIQRVISSVVRVNRGRLNIKGISEKALKIGTKRMITVERLKG